MMGLPGFFLCYYTEFHKKARSSAFAGALRSASDAEARELRGRRFGFCISGFSGPAIFYYATLLNARALMLI